MWPARAITAKYSKQLLSSAVRLHVPPTTVLSCRQYGYVHVPKKKIPHILGPGWLWRKCFIVHPQTQTLDPLTKYQWLTKSVVVNDLPDQILSMPPPEQSLLDDYLKRAEEFLAFQIHNRQTEHGLPFTKLEMSSFFQSTLASLWFLGNQYDHLSQSHLTYCRDVKCYWRRNGDNYLCVPTPLYMVRTMKALGLFCRPDFQGDTIPPLQYKPSHLGLFEHSVDQILPSGGAQSRSPFPMAHTLLVHDHGSHSVEQLHAHGLMQLFSQAAAEAVQNGFKIDEQLPYPLVNQGILTDGKTFTFVCFQLNTLDLRKDSDSDGVNNVFWAGPSLKLYERVERGRGVEEFNESCAGLLLKFLLNEPVRQRPRLWGYGRHALSKRRLSMEGQELAT